MSAPRKEQVLEAGISGKFTGSLSGFADDNSGRRQRKPGHGTGFHAVKFEPVLQAFADTELATEGVESADEKYANKKTPVRALGRAMAWFGDGDGWRQSPG